MLVWPMASPKMTRRLGLRPDGAAGAGAGVAPGAAGAVGWVCASAPEVRVAAATRVEGASRILRRLTARSSVKASVCLLVLSSVDIQLSALCTPLEFIAWVDSLQRTGIRGDWWRYRSPRHAVPPGDSGGSNSARTDASRP